MIQIDRTKVAEPTVLTKPNPAGATETARAIAHFTSVDKDKKFEFSRYREPEVKSSLIQIFNGKCAYCESTFLHVYSGDVEHFRPKGEISDVTDTKPGYYWLAATWDNLLLSCRNCNQLSTHVIYGEKVEKTAGKMNQFPLFDETHRARIHNHAINTIINENSFCKLINPCIDNPELFFKYDIKTGVIKAKLSGNDKVKALTSIEVFVLQRHQLVLARQGRLIEILSQIQRIKEAFSNFEKCSSSNNKYLFTKVHFEKVLKRELKVLHSFLRLDQPYLGMARQVINDFLSINFNIISYSPPPTL